MELTAKKPRPMKVVESYEDTGAGLIELPILVETEELDLSRTKGGGKTKSQVTMDMMRQMVSNFADYPGPVPVGTFPHVDDFIERAGPSPAYIEKCWIKGDALMAHIWLCSYMYSMIVTDEMYRGFSVEIYEDFVLASHSFTGWVLTGGVFVNRPATDTHFKKIAASGEAEFTAYATSAATLSLSERQESEDTEMTDVKSITLASHEAKLSEVNVELGSEKLKVVNLTTDLEVSRKRTIEVVNENDGLRLELSTASTELASLKAQKDHWDLQLKNLEEAKSALETKVVELAQTNDDIENKILKENVLETIKLSVEAGVPPSIFKGHEVNPVTWLKKNYASLESFQGICKSLSGVKIKLGDNKSSGTPNDDGDPDKKDKDGSAVNLSDDTKAKMKDMNLLIDFVGIHDEKSALAIIEKRKAVQK